MRDNMLNTNWPNCLPWLVLTLAIISSRNVCCSSGRQNLQQLAKSRTLMLSQCSHIQPDIVPESSTEVTRLLQPWRNQCPFHSAYTGFWFPAASNAPQSSWHTPIDAKCCSTPADVSLSDVLMDLHNLDGGPFDVSATWNVQCPPHSYITGIRISESPGNRHKKHISAVKCSLLINHVVDYKRCQSIDILRLSGGTRDPNKSWNAECPPSMRMVALHDDAGFTKIKYAKCCAFTDYGFAPNLPWKCTFANPPVLCQWKNRVGSKLRWEVMKSTGGSTYSFASLMPNKVLGKAQLLSPGMPSLPGMVCLRLEHYVLGLVKINVYKRAYVEELHFTNVSLLGEVRSPRSAIGQTDFLIQSETPFQIIIEGVREDAMGLLHITQMLFVNLSTCNRELCKPPAIGCQANEACLLSNGFLRCVCIEGFHKVRGACVPQNPTYKPLETTRLPTTSQKNTGNRGGGKTDNGGKEKRPVGKKGGQDMNAVKSKWGSWVYTAIGATAGIFLVLLFVFGFMMYRKKVNEKNNRHSFVMEMRRRSFHPFDLVGDGTGASEGCMGRSVNVYVDHPQRGRIDSIWSSSAGQVERQLDTSSSISGSPNSHHYHELEPDDDVFEARRFSQFTLIHPVYGSSEDLAEANGNMFSEPPFDEDELLNKLGREISYHAITLKEEIGHGAFGFVKLGYWDKHNNERIKVAVKMLKEPTTNEERVKFLQEAAIMRQFDHTNVIRMYGIVTRFCSPMIVLEYMSNKNLRKYLHRQRRIRERANLGGVDYDLHRLFLRMAREIAAGMSYLHSLQFVHRDLAARNILLDSNLVCKIGDFGLARDLIGCEYYESGGGVIPVRWTAPEAIHFKRYSSHSDTWSFGITLHEIWSLGIKPYSEWDNNTVIERVARGYRLPPPLNCPRVIYHLMIDCWHPEPSKRPRFSQIKFCLSHHDDRLIGRVPRHDRIRSVTCNDIVDNQEQGLYDDLQYIYCKTE